MARFKLKIEYDGTRYSGWQKQYNAKTVQGVLLEAAGNIFKGERLDIQGSGRTDSGVHALCQVAHLDVRTVLAPHIIQLKFNDAMPKDINILNVEKTNPNFHARHDAVSRMYLYQISKRRTSFGKNYVWWIKDNLNFNKMVLTAEYFKGMKNFASFTDDNPGEKSTKVLIEDIQLAETEALILIRITGSHFLWKMVRRMIGVIAEVGRGKLDINRVPAMLNSDSDIPAKLTAPPSGLFLEQVLYKGDKPKQTLEPTINF